MTTMIVGLIVFLGSHLLPCFPKAQAALKARLGEMPYKGVYSIVALVGIVLVVIGYGDWREAGAAQLWVPPVWLRHLSLLIMLPVFPLLVAAYTPAGRIKPAVKHPMILAVKVWAFAHLLANGDAASLVLFGGFLAWGVIDRISLKRREAAGYVRTAEPGPIANDIVPVAIGLVVYGLFVWKLHQWLIGVPVVY